jgi:hypothetical protein
MLSVHGFFVKSSNASGPYLRAEWPKQIRPKALEIINQLIFCMLLKENETK